MRKKRETGSLKKMVSDESLNLAADLPSRDALGRDLFETSPIQRVLTVAAPFLALAAYVLFSFRLNWVAAFFCVVWFSFATYGSSSHDLVHRNLGLSPRVNRFLLYLVERLALRTGHAYELAHFEHHRVYPVGTDVEAGLIHAPFWKFLLAVPVQTFRVWLWAWKNPRSHKLPLILDVIWFGGFCTASWIFRESVPQLGFYAILVYLGSWAIPFVTVLLPHRPEGRTPLEHTRLFRGRLFHWIFLRHLYHLEHHLYPSVPHHHWPRLAVRLDPYFKRKGIPVVRSPF